MMAKEPERRFQEPKEVAQRAHRSSRRGAKSVGIETGALARRAGGCDTGADSGRRLRPAAPHAHRAAHAGVAEARAHKQQL